MAEVVSDGSALNWRNALAAALHAGIRGGAARARSGLRLWQSISTRTIHYSAHLDQLQALGFPLLAGVSRKGFPGPDACFVLMPRQEMCRRLRSVATRHLGCYHSRGPEWGRILCVCMMCKPAAEAVRQLRMQFWLRRDHSWAMAKMQRNACATTPQRSGWTSLGV